MIKTLKFKAITESVSSTNPHDAETISEFLNKDMRQVLEYVVRRAGTSSSAQGSVCKPALRDAEKQKRVGKTPTNDVYIDSDRMTNLHSLSRNGNAGGSSRCRIVWRCRAETIMGSRAHD
jgi:hypothetical protein